MIGWMWTSSPCSPSAQPQPAWCAPAQRAAVEPVLELLPVLGFPGIDGEAVLLLDTVLAFLPELVALLWQEPMRFFVCL